MIKSHLEMRFSPSGEVVDEDGEHFVVDIGHVSFDEWDPSGFHRDSSGFEIFLEAKKDPTSSDFRVGYQFKQYLVSDLEDAVWNATRCVSSDIQPGEIRELHGCILEWCKKFIEEYRSRQCEQQLEVLHSL